MFYYYFFVPSTVPWPKKTHNKRLFFIWTHLLVKLREGMGIFPAPSTHLNTLPNSIFCHLWDRDDSLGLCSSTNLLSVKNCLDSSKWIFMYVICVCHHYAKFLRNIILVILINSLKQKAQLLPLLFGRENWRLEYHIQVYSARQLRSLRLSVSKLPSD